MLPFVITSLTAPFGALALRVALIGGNRLCNCNRGSQSNRRESSYCQCLKTSQFVHSFFLQLLQCSFHFQGSLTNR